LGEVERAGGLPQDGVWVVQVGLDVVGRALRGAGKQRAGVHQDQRIVVDIDDPRLRGHRLGDLMRIVRGGQPGTDVEELADPGLTGQEPHGAAEERPISASGGAHVRQELQDLFSDLPVGGEVVLAAQPVVPDPCGMRHARVEPRLERLVGRACRVFGHACAPSLRAVPVVTSRAA
jgi:hypothetical protein